MKKIFSISNIILFLMFAFVIYMQAPAIVNHFHNEGKKISTKSYQQVLPLHQNQTVLFPPENANVVALFWASWCGPCKIEMKRLKTSVENGKLSGQSIFAINPFESRLEVDQFLKANKYPFTFIEAPEIARELKINATPTVLFIEKGKITSMSSGISLIGIWKAENFLKSKD